MANLNECAYFSVSRFSFICRAADSVVLCTEFDFVKSLHSMCCQFRDGVTVCVHLSIHEMIEVT